LSLFRVEALEAQRRHLFGSVAIQQPVRFSVLTAALAGIGVICLAYAGFATFPQKETVSGRVVPESGLIDIATADAAGRLSALNVEIGDSVAAGQTLATLSMDRYAPQGSLSEQQMRQTQTRLDEVAIQSADARAKAALEAERLQNKVRSLSDDADRLEDDVANLRRQLALAERQLKNIDPLVAKGFVSVIERDRREQVVLDYQRSLSDVLRQIASQRAEARDSESQLRLLRSSASSEASQLRSAKAGLDQALAEQEAQSAIVLKAPVAGTIAGINSRLGQLVAPGAPIVTIAPAGALVAELMIPTSAAGHVETGQSVRLMVDAFPFQKFGFLRGRIVEVSNAPVPSSDLPLQPGQLPPSPSYRLRVAIDPVSLAEHESHGRLSPGMTVKADIVTARETGLGLIFKPVIGARARQLE
jgi:membrane fusion protein